MTPVIDGRLHHFGHRGLFNALSVLGDAETGSYWDHVTGRCVHGPLLGKVLATGLLMHTTAGQALAMRPDAFVAISRPSLFARIMGRLAEWTRLSRRGFFPPGFRSTMGRVDSRLPAMEMGLGVWNEQKRRFYPTSVIRGASGALCDRLGDEPIVVYLDPATKIPSALRMSTTRATIEGSDVRVDSGLIRNGRLLREGAPLESPSRPMQLFTRWYGFSFTFPDCDIHRG